MGAGNGRSGRRGSMTFSCAVADSRTPGHRRVRTDPLIRSSFRVHLPGSSHGGFQPSHLTGQKEPSLSGGEKPLLISRVAVGLRNLLFDLGGGFTARKHFDCSLVRQRDARIRAALSVQYSSPWLLSSQPTVT